MIKTSVVTPDQLENLLKTGIVKFSFQKLDGSLRPAYGTLDERGIPVDKRGKSTVKKGTSVPFFDVELQEWRAMHKDAKFVVEKVISV